MVTEIIEETTVTEVPVTTTVVSVDTNNISTNITESTESPALNTTAATTITANINTTVATLRASTTAGLSSTTNLSSGVKTEVTPPSVTNAENVTEKIESIFDENNNTLNTTQLTIGDGITQKTEDGDAIVLQKFAVEEVRVKNLFGAFFFF